MFESGVVKYSNCFSDLGILEKLLFPHYILIFTEFLTEIIFYQIILSPCSMFSLGFNALED